MSRRASGSLRATLAHAAARVMYEEDVKEYLRAKRIAARRIYGRGGQRVRPFDLPSNAEIRDALRELAAMYEGEARATRLFAMRVVALETMSALEAFAPRLIGSVGSGHVRRGSDIDLHVFCDAEDDLFACLSGLGWAHEVQRVSILKGGAPRDYVHVHLDDIFPIELTVHDRRALRERPRSSIDGRPIVRLSSAALRGLLRREHADAFAAYEASGAFPELSELLDPMDGSAPAGAEPTEAVDDDRL